jgi:methionyl-tRNA formyltransferase
VSHKIIVLTTESPHHAFYVAELLKYCSSLTVYLESKPNASLVSSALLPFEMERDQFEIDRWFGGVDTHIHDILKPKVFDNLNDSSAVKSLSCEDPCVVIAFGVGVLSRKVIELFPCNIFNLHGGDPEQYRGLDSHLWAIYHSDFSALITTLHRLSIDLDGGSICMQADLDLYPNMPLYALRAINTEACVKMSISLVECMQRFGSVQSRRQRQKGRYYSSMPSTLKEICLNRFTNFSKTLSR